MTNQLKNAINKRVMEDSKKELRRKKASETRAQKLAESRELEKFERYVDRKTSKFRVVAKFKRPYLMLMRGWTEEQSQEKMRESVEDFRKSFSFEDFRAGRVENDDKLDKDVAFVRKVLYNEPEPECKHRFEWMRPSHKRICIHCGEESTEKILGTGMYGFRGKRFSKT